MRRKKKVASSKQLFDRRFGLRWGRLLEGLAAARYSLAVSYGEKALLSPGLRDELQDIHHHLAGLEQRAWTEEQKAAERTDL